MYTEDVQSLTLGCRRTCCFTDGYWEPELLFSKIPQTDQANYTHPSSRSIGKCQEGWGQGQEVCKVLVSTLRVGTRGRGRSRVPYRMFMRQNRLAILFPRSHAPRGNARPGTLPRPVSHVHAAKSVSDSLDAGASKTCVPARSVGTRKKRAFPRGAWEREFSTLQSSWGQGRSVFGVRHLAAAFVCPADKPSLPVRTQPSTHEKARASPRTPKMLVPRPIMARNAR